MNRPCHVLLDLDGTISDSLPGIAQSLRHALVTCGFDPLTDEEVRPLIGPPFEHTLPALGISGSDIERVVVAYREHYDTVGLFENVVYPGIAEMLGELADAGHALVLATAKPQPTAVRIIDHFGFTAAFALQVGATVEFGSHRRTKEEVITHALKQLGLSPRAEQPVVMVGDRHHDVDGATSNGVPCIGVTWGFGSRDELLNAGAVGLVDTPGEVAAAVAATYRSGRP